MFKKTKPSAGAITIFTPSFADEENTNAQNLTVREIVSRLAPELFHVTMLYIRNPDLRIVNRENTRLLPYRRHGNTARLLGRVLFQPDIYFYPRQGALDSAFFFFRKRLRLRTKVVTHIVMVMNDATGTGLVARSIVEGDAVFANSPYVSCTVRERFGVPAATIYNGIDQRFFFPSHDLSKERNSQPLVVLYAGSFQARKRVELVIEQAARLPRVFFRFVGRGETESSCRILVERLGCKNVLFLGHRSQAQLGEEMRQSDVFLFPSILEGHPQVLGQAAACGLPVIAMNAYRPEYVIHGESGFLVESDADLAQKLDLLIGNPALRLSMSAAAVAHSHKFDWDHIAGQWAEVFQEVVARH
jgi:glycosyltransferase involved in cell wall biosynthesis